MSPYRKELKQEERKSKTTSSLFLFFYGLAGFGYNAIFYVGYYALFYITYCLFFAIISPIYLIAKTFIDYGYSLETGEKFVLRDTPRHERYFEYFKVKMEYENFLGTSLISGIICYILAGIALAIIYFSS